MISSIEDVLELIDYFAKSVFYKVYFYLRIHRFAFLKLFCLLTTSIGISSMLITTSA
jgi:hypothetical protein